MRFLIEQDSRDVQVETIAQLIKIVSEMVGLGYTKDYYLSDNQKWLLCDGVQRSIKEYDFNYLLYCDIEGTSFEIWSVEMKELVDSKGLLIVFGGSSQCESILTKLLARPELPAVN
jgi:hypothetical protein